MRLFFLNLSCFLLTFSLVGQNTYELKLEQSFNDEPTSIVQCSNNTFVGYNSSIDEELQSSSMVKINESGEIVDSIIFEGDNLIKIKEFVKKSENNFYCIGERVEEDHYYLWIGLLDENLGLIEEHNIIDISYSILQTHTIVNKGLAIAGFGYEDDYKVFIIKLNEQMELEYSNTFYEEEDGICTGFMFDSIVQKYYMYTYMGFSLLSPGQIVIMNSEFMMDTIIPTPKNIHYQYTIKYLNDSTYILGGRVIDFDDLNIALSVNNLNHESVAYFEIENEIVDDIPCFYKTFDFYSKENVFLTGTLNFIFYINNIYFHEVDNRFVITKLDERLNFKWQKFYGGDAYYTLYNSIATEDGGFIVIGTIYDENKAENLRDIYILKVDSLGNYIPANIDNEINESKIVIYPNPGTDYFELDLRSEKMPVKMELYDMAGKQVLNLNIENTYQKVNTAHFTKGIYLIRLTNRNNLQKTVKWIKN